MNKSWLCKQLYLLGGFRFAVITTEKTELGISDF